MLKHRFAAIWLSGGLLLLAALACSALQAPTPTPSPTKTTAAPSKPTTTARPTATTIPTATPNATATQEALDLQRRIRQYVQSGYLPSDKGSYVKLQDATVDMAKMNFLNFEDAGYEDKTASFAAWADVKLTSASAVNYPEYSGCGFTFRLTDKGDAYTAMVTKDRVLLTSCRNHGCYELGKTRGSGRLGYEGDFQAKLDLIVNDSDVNFLVDGQQIGEYTLSSDYLTDPGYVAYSIISGTNKDYGTRCQFSNAGLWVPQP